MSFSLRSRWTAPAVAVVAVVVALAVSPMVADAAPSLPARTAAELLASTRAAVDHPFSGTVAQTARLGLPDLPSTHGRSTSLSIAALATGSHTARVWYAGPGRTRIALVDELAETDVIRDGRDVWTWSSTDNAATHLVLPAEAGHPPATSALTPDQAAAAVLQAVEPTTEVSVEGTASVAGRSAYELVLRPRDAGSLVAQVRLAIDAVTSTPLRVEVFARGGSDPAFETAFTSIRFATPAASVFRFSPPPGATVTEQTPQTPPATAAMPTKAPGGQPAVVGKGWTSVLVLAGVDPSVATGSAELDALLGSAQQVTGSYGSGRVLRTALVSVLLLDDGRLLIGSVTPEVLEQAAVSAG